MFLNVKDVIAGAFKYKIHNYDRAKYIVKRLREISDNILYNFCCLVLDRRLTNQDWGLYFSYYQNIYFKYYLENKYIIVWSGK